MNHQRRLARRGLSTQADNRVLVTLLAVDRCGTFKVSRDLGSVRRQQCNRRLRVRIGHRVFDGVVERSAAARPIDVVQHLPLFHHLLVDRGSGFVVAYENR